MDAPEQPNPNKSTFKVLVIVVIVLFALAAYWIYQNTRAVLPPQNNVYNQQPTMPPTTIPQEGSLILQLGQGQIGSVGKPIDIDILASSGVHAIVGYDLLFQYDPSLIDVVRLQSLLPDFTLYSAKKTDHYTGTGVKSLSSKTQTILNGTAIAKITVVPKKAGTLTLTLLPSSGVEKTQMVDDKTHILNPYITRLTIEIK